MRLSLATIIVNSELRPGVHLLELRAPQLAQAAQPGQYCMVRCCDSQASDPLLRRPYFIHGAQRANEQCTLLVAARGRGSSWLARQPPGTTLDLLGPLGHGWELRPNTHNLLLIGEAPALTALTLLAQSAIEQEIAVTLLCHFSSEAAIYPPSLLSPEIEYHVSLGPDRAGLVELVAPYLPWADTICCSVSRETLQLLYERFERLRQPGSAQAILLRPFVCGSGVCLTCSVETNAGLKLACHDGPVFALEDIVTGI
jgi:dihydroorotate dehydrogenase electron transfer subunit